MKETAVSAPTGSVGGRILFVDDDEPFRTGLGRRLERAGFACECASTGDEAAKALLERPFDVVLADIDMPGNQQLELLQRVHSIASFVPVVLLTGRPTVETAARSVALKVAAYLVKPPDFDELCGVLSAAVVESRGLRFVVESRSRLQSWEKEVARLQSLLERSSAEGRGETMRSYLRLTLRNLVVSLVEFESLLNSGEVASEVTEAIDRQQMRAALRKTVTVLERTRDHFKSKELGDLRKELADLIG